MNRKQIVLSRKAMVINELGLHARPAAMIAKIARKTEGSVSLRTNGRTVNAASMIDVLTLSCSKNTEITISISQEKDVQILEEIESIIRSGFGE
jgi:phosphocarrier protein HPr